MAHARNHISVIRFAWHVFPGGQVFPGGRALAGGHGFPWPPGAPCGPAGAAARAGRTGRSACGRPRRLLTERIWPRSKISPPHTPHGSRRSIAPARHAARSGQPRHCALASSRSSGIRREPEPGVPVAAGHRLDQFDGLPGQHDHGSTAHVAPQVWSPLAPRPSWHRPNRLQVGDDPRKVNSSRCLMFRRNVGGRIDQNADLAPASWSSVRWRRRSRSNGRRRASFRT